MPGYGGSVENNHQGVIRVVAVAQEGQHALGAVIRTDPFEAVAVEVALMKGGLSPYQVVQCADQVLDSHVVIGVSGVPADAAFVGPFGPLAKFTPHEQQFLAWVCPHQAVEQAQVGKFLPVVTRHLGQQAAFAIDDLIMGQGQDKVFVECVVQAETECVLVVAAMYRVLFEP